MIEIPITITVKVKHLNRIADALERLVFIQSAARLTFKLSPNLGEEDMPTYKSDRPDFDATVQIIASDSEGNPIPGSPIPTGHTLTVTSDNPGAIDAVQDPLDPRVVHYHVGGPNADGTPSQANVQADLTDPAGNLIATGAALVTVTVGDPTAITSINLNLPD